MEDDDDDDENGEDEDEGNGDDDDELIERQVIEEFGKCLAQIIQTAEKTKKKSSLNEDDC
jgi:hypothetical protein